MFIYIPRAALISPNAPKPARRKSDVLPTQIRQGIFTKTPVLTTVATIRESWVLRRLDIPTARCAGPSLHSHDKTGILPRETLQKWRIQMTVLSPLPARVR